MSEELPNIMMIYLYYICPLPIGYEDHYYNTIIFISSLISILISNDRTFSFVRSCIHNTILYFTPEFRVLPTISFRVVFSAAETLLTIISFVSFITFFLLLLSIYFLITSDGIRDVFPENTSFVKLNKGLRNNTRGKNKEGMTYKFV